MLFTRVVVSASSRGRHMSQVSVFLFRAYARIETR